MVEDDPAPARHRFRVLDGKVYLLRDVFVGSKFLGCEYAVLTYDEQLSWQRCREGVELSEIEPLGEVSQ